jgi:serine O-acetyltransferase
VVVGELINLFSKLREDIQTVRDRDPAARNTLEILTCYPGLHALWLHRTANFLWRRRLRLVARLVSHGGRFVTGIEIHPGARIGRRFFIDHGSGVVIGQTTEIGDDVLMYQGVVLGGTSLEKGKRHPTLRNNVVIGSAAIVLGPIVVGEGARVGANSVVVRDVPEGAVVVGVPGRVVEDPREHTMDLQHGELPDPFSEAMRLILDEQIKLRNRVARIESSQESDIVPDETFAKIQALQKVFMQGSGDGI